MKTNLRFAVVLVTFLCAISALAHHSPARFLEDQIVAVYGTITRVDWKNPHVYLVVEDDKGTEWLFETNATSNLQRNGWTRDSFRAGDKVSVRAHANRDPAKTHAMLISAIDPEGREYATRVVSQDPSRTINPSSTTSLNGVWRGDPELAFDFLFGMIDHPVTAKAEAARLQYDESMDPVAGCVTWPTPRLVAWGAFYLVEMEINDDAVYFRSEFDRTERVIHMDGRKHPENGQRTNQGHSIGWWEGATLVVDTTLFADSLSPVADGVPSGSLKHVIEKYTLSEDGTHATIVVWVEDPEYLAEPFSAELIWNYAPHLDMLAFDCDPEVSRRFIQ